MLSFQCELCQISFDFSLIEEIFLVGYEKPTNM